MLHGSLPGPDEQAQLILPLIYSTLPPMLAIINSHSQGRIQDFQIEGAQNVTLHAHMMSEKCGLPYGRGSRALMLSLMVSEPYDAF